MMMGEGRLGSDQSFPLGGFDPPNRLTLVSRPSQLDCPAAAAGGSSAFQGESVCSADRVGLALTLGG